MAIWGKKKGVICALSLFKFSVLRGLLVVLCLGSYFFASDEPRRAKRKQIIIVTTVESLTVAVALQLAVFSS